MADIILLLLLLCQAGHGRHFQLQKEGSGVAAPMSGFNYGTGPGG